MVERASSQATADSSVGTAERGGASRTYVCDRQALDRLFAALSERGYELIGPTRRDGAVVYDTLTSTADLPVGWTDDQDAGRYRLLDSGDEQLFGYVVGPHSWKRHLFPPAQRLWQATIDGMSMAITPEPDDARRRALIGVRSCELEAMIVQDKVFLGGPYRDPVYGQRRENVFILAVNCTRPGGTCFCTSMDTGPRARAGFDLALTELCDDAGHRFTLEVGSPLGEELLQAIAPAEAAERDLRSIEEHMEAAAGRMGRALQTDGLKELLEQNYEHPRWEQVARRCLACANCTLVCPTCFCSTVEDTTDLGGDAERWRKWDSCFTREFSYIAGGSVRSSTRSRYRQWMTHKLASWHEQFGTSGCVGCGRCITWCPVGIDITEEADSIRRSVQHARSQEDGHGQSR